ncbi:hypothetical protein MNAN1_002750 [Malassezia nana]|uniref:SWIM-type domain-containing protein n=1 Tax=Malassezia nana TaxID=180528 RepID=A0AAF0J870_9BASI|nr:hypothetical protein MNAN1_002750 [Malassezia nana]
MLQTKERERQDATFKKIVPFLNAFREANPGTLAVVEQHPNDPAISEAQLAVLPASGSTTHYTRLDWTASGSFHEYYAQMAHLCSNSYFVIIVGWITQVAVLIYARYMELESERSVFPGGILGRSNMGFNGWDVASFGPSDYLVVNAHEKQQVNLALRTCSCGQWIEHSFPCIHATRCLPLERLVGLGQFVHPSYFTESLRRCYSRRMTLIDANAITPQGESPLNEAGAFVNEHGVATGPDGVLIPQEFPLLPPTTIEPVKRGRGRPRVVRTNNHSRGTGLGAMYQCGHCHGKGHNSRTCPLNQKSDLSSSAAAAQVASVALGPAPTATPANVFGEAGVPFAMDASLSTTTPPV